jgi:hypothetical protein
MDSFPISAFFLAAFAGLACTSASNAPPVDPFLGKWSCAETRTLTFVTPADQAPTRAVAQSIFVLGMLSGKLTATALSEAGVSCSLGFTEMGSSAMLANGQSCPTADGMTLTYTTGTADVGSFGLRTNLAFEFAGMLPDPAGGAPLDSTGSGTTVSTCSRIAPLNSGGPTGGGGW